MEILIYKCECCSSFLVMKHLMGSLIIIIKQKDVEILILFTYCKGFMYYSIILTFTFNSNQNWYKHFY